MSSSSKNYEKIDTLNYSTLVESNNANLIGNTNNYMQQHRFKIKRPKSEIGSFHSNSNNAFSLINLNEAINPTVPQSSSSNHITSNVSSSSFILSNHLNVNFLKHLSNRHQHNQQHQDMSNQEFASHSSSPFYQLSSSTIKKNLKLSNSAIGSQHLSNKQASNSSFTLSNFNINCTTNQSTRSHSNQNHRNYFFNRHSKSINEESADYETIKALRESVDSLNYKFEENAFLTSVVAISGNASTSNQFKASLNELNKEFNQYDTEFSANNWADLQNEEFLQSLSKQSRNKQENIFEFMKTEVNYVKILSITQKVYVKVMVNECKVEMKQIHQIFPDLDRLIEFHQSLLAQLVERYKVSSHKYIESFGDILLKNLSEKCDDIVEIYSKVCCTHLTAKSLYKQLSLNNKSFINFLQECRKHAMLKRYQIPDCLTIITQRLTKYLTLIENMNSNSKEDKQDLDLLTKSLEKLKLILTRVNDAVANYQNTNEFKRLIDNIDNKSFTYYSQLKSTDSKKLEQIKFNKTDLINGNNKSTERKLLSINQVTVKCMSKNAKVYKDVTCLTMSDVIVFLQLNDKNKYVFMNESSCIPFTNGILIRPKLNELSSSTSTHNRSSSFSSSSTSLSTTNQNNNSTNQNQNSFNPNSSSSSTLLPSYIVNTITNEIIELKFPDESSRNQWLTLVHTHILPLIDDVNTSSGNMNSSSGTSTKESDAPTLTSNSTTATSQLESIMLQRVQTNSSISSSSGNLLQYQNSVTSNSSTSSNSSVKNKGLKIATDVYAPPLMQAIQVDQQQTQDNAATSIAQPLLIANTYRCNSNISNRSTISSGQSSFISTFSTSSSSSSNKQVNSGNCDNANDLANTNSSIVSSPKRICHNCDVNGESSSLESYDMLLSNDLANILYSFNNLFEENLFHGTLMRSASSAGETVTRQNQIIHVSVPKRAETFNGASSTKEAQHACTVDLNSEIFKSRAFKNSNKSTSNSITNLACNLDMESNGTTSTTSSSGVVATVSRNSSDSSSSGCAGVLQTNSDLSATDSGYHSRLCVDLNHDLDGDGCSCAFFENNSTKHSANMNKFNKLKNLKSNSNLRQQHQGQMQQGNSHPKRLDSSSSSTSTSSASNTATTAMSRAHFESILKYILNDYMRLKNENDSLRKELCEKNNSIDLMKTTMQECKNQLDFEKKDFQMKFNEFEKKEEATSNLNTNILCISSSNEAANGKCESTNNSVQTNLNSQQINKNVNNFINYYNTSSNTNDETMKQSSNKISIFVKNTTNDTCNKKQQEDVCNETASTTQLSSSTSTTLNNTANTSIFI